MSAIPFAQKLCNQAKKQIKKLFDIKIGLTARSADPYATHVPILVGVAAVCKPALLVEFGSGTFSTLAFLESAAFPSLQRVESYENNPEWFEQMRGRIPPTAHVKLHCVEGEMYRAVDGANVSSAGVIFIDDSPTSEARVPTVKEVARLCGTEPVVVLHDHDYWRLRWATRSFEHRVAFNAFNPQTCVMWHGHPERVPVFEKMARIIAKNANSTPLTDIRAWAKIFSQDI